MLCRQAGLRPLGQGPRPAPDLDVLIVNHGLSGGAVRPALGWQGAESIRVVGETLHCTGRKPASFR